MTPEQRAALARAIWWDVHHDHPEPDIDPDDPEA